MDESLLLSGVKDEFRVELQVAFRLDGKVGEEVLLVDIDAAEPVAVGDLLDPRHPEQFLLVGDGEGKDQGDGVPGDEPAGGGGLDAGIPGADHGAQQAEGKDGDGDADDGEQVRSRCRKAFLMRS